MNLGFKKSLSESTLYVKKTDGQILVVSLYVDDLLVSGSSEEHIDKFKEEMKDVFEMTDLGRMTFFLGMQVYKNKMKYFFARKNMQMKFSRSSTWKGANQLQLP